MLVPNLRYLVQCLQRRNSPDFLAVSHSTPAKQLHTAWMDYPPGTFRHAVRGRTVLQSPVPEISDQENGVTVDEYSVSCHYNFPARLVSYNFLVQVEQRSSWTPVLSSLTTISRSACSVPIAPLSRNDTMMFHILLLLSLLGMEYRVSCTSNGILTSVPSDLTCYTRYRQHGTIEIVPTSTTTRCTTKNVTKTVHTSTRSTITFDAITVTVKATIYASARPASTTMLFITITASELPASSQSRYTLDLSPFEVDCLKQETTLCIATTITTTLTQAVTVQPSTTSVTDTQYIYSLPLLTAIATATITVTVSLSPPISSCLFLRETTTLLPATTNPQLLRCAPSNLISAIPPPVGLSVPITHLHPRGTNAIQRLLPFVDASACCQLCVEIEDCVAMASDPSAGNCFLWFTSPSCGVAFEATGDAAGSAADRVAFVVQQGCGDFVLGNDS
nr:hypothetical protein CFP56_64630 [Quercus suber]